jgi:hypothetical protein
MEHKDPCYVMLTNGLRNYHSILIFVLAKERPLCSGFNKLTLN